MFYKRHWYVTYVYSCHHTNYHDDFGFCVILYWTLKQTFDTPALVVWGSSVDGLVLRNYSSRGIPINVTDISYKVPLQSSRFQTSYQNIHSIPQASFSQFSEYNSTYIYLPYWNITLYKYFYIIYSFVQSQVTNRDTAHDHTLQSKYRIIRNTAQHKGSTISSGATMQNIGRQQLKSQLNTLSFFRCMAPYNYVMNLVGAGGNRSRGLSLGRRDS